MPSLYALWYSPRVLLAMWSDWLMQYMTRCRTLLRCTHRPRRLISSSNSFTPAFRQDAVFQFDLGMMLLIVCGWLCRSPFFIHTLNRSPDHRFPLPWSQSWSFQKGQICFFPRDLVWSTYTSYSSSLYPYTLHDLRIRTVETCVLFNVEVGYVTMQILRKHPLATTGEENYYE